MAKTTTDSTEGFGRRLAVRRKEAGYTQQELADEIGATRRMIAYYETESDHPPTSMLVNIARALNVTTDELLGLTPAAKGRSKQPDSRLLRRMQQIEKLDAATKRQVVQVIDTFIENARLRKRA
ncbi:MAG: helix-turn-helix transcriptional regulator [Anaerolineae bacterium]|nr:helix-turn-helix transcriptional regulator [Anaerolineae bacterium]